MKEAYTINWSIKQARDLSGVPERKFPQRKWWLGRNRYMSGRKGLEEFKHITPIL